MAKRNIIIISNYMNYYIICNGRQIGPVSKEELLNYGLTPNSMVWTEGMPNWASAYTVPELRDLLRQRRTTPPPYENQSGTYPPQYDLFDSLTSTGTSGKSRLVFALFAIFLGWLGLQYFYVNKTMAGIISIILTALSCGIWQTVSLIQGILVIVMSQDEFERKFVYSSGFPVF